jgi:hypothetical protein
MNRPDLSHRARFLQTSFLRLRVKSLSRGRVVLHASVVDKITVEVSQFRRTSAPGRIWIRRRYLVLLNGSSKLCFALDNASSPWNHARHVFVAKLPPSGSEVLREMAMQLCCLNANGVPRAISLEKGTESA